MVIASIPAPAAAHSPSPRARALEVPAVIAGSVNLLKFSEALARASLVGRHDAKRGVLVIEPVPPRCPACGGTGFDEDARCEFCNGTGRAPHSGRRVISKRRRELYQQPQAPHHNCPVGGNYGYPQE